MLKSFYKSEGSIQQVGLLLKEAPDQGSEESVCGASNGKTPRNTVVTRIGSVPHNFEWTKRDVMLLNQPKLSTFARFSPKLQAPTFFDQVYLSSNTLLLTIGLPHLLEMALRVADSDFLRSRPLLPDRA